MSYLIRSCWSHVKISHIQVAWFGEVAGGAEEEKPAPRPPLSTCYAEADFDLDRSQSLSHFVPQKKRLTRRFPRQRLHPQNFYSEILSKI